MEGQVREHPIDTQTDGKWPYAHTVDTADRLLDTRRDLAGNGEIVKRLHRTLALYGQPIVQLLFNWPKTDGRTERKGERGSAQGDMWVAARQVGPINQQTGQNN